MSTLWSEMSYYRIKDMSDHDRIIYESAKIEECISINEFKIDYNGNEDDDEE